MEHCGAEASSASLPATRPWKNYATASAATSKTIAMLMALNDPERIKAEINGKADSNNS